MRTRVIQGLSLAFLAVSVAWFVAAPGPEPFVTALAGLIGLVSSRPEASPGGRAARKSVRRGAASMPGAAGRGSTAPWIDAAPGQKSIAVLPFRNLSGDAGSDYVSDGLTEDIIADLARVPDLKIISWSSVVRFRSEEPDLARIGEQLGVGAVLEGSVRQHGDRVRVVARLTDLDSHAQVWGQRYDLELTDILSVQARVAEEVAAVLGGEPSSGGRSSKDPTPEAYKLQLLGRYHINKWSVEGWHVGVHQLEQAIRIDPDYAAPRALLAYSFCVGAYINFVAPTDVLPRAVAEAREALEIDEADTDAHMALGLVSYWFEWQWERALQHLTRAVRISPGNATAQTFLGSLLDTLGRHDEAVERRRLGYELDPLDATSVLNFGYGHLIGRDFDEAIAIFERALELDPRSAAATYGLGMAQVDGGRFAEGCRTFEGGIRDVEEGSTMKGFLGWSLALAGRTEDAEAVLEEILADDDSRPVSPYHVGLVYLGLGRLDEYFEWLEAAFQQRSIWMAWFHVSPHTDPVRSDPRFEAMVDRMRFPEAASPRGGRPASA